MGKINIMITVYVIENKGRFMIKFKKTLATALAFSLIFGLGNKALADEATSSPSLFDILTSDMAGSKHGENKDKKENKEINKDFEKDPAYQEEFKARLDLYEKTLVAKELKEVDETKFIDILNKKAASKEELEKVLAELNKQIEAADEKVALDLDLDGCKKDVENYILNGKLFFLDSLDKKDIKNLYLFYEATVNSTSFTKANEEEKKDIKPLLQQIYDFILEVDEKVKTKVEITEEDKAKTADLYTNLAKAIEKKIANPNHKSTSIEKTAFLTSDNQNADINKNSKFYTSTRTGIKDAYENLSPEQRTYLDQINTNNDDYISDDEIKADGKYKLPLEDTNFLKPFYGNPQAVQKQVSMDSRVVDDGDDDDDQAESTISSNSTTPQNPQGGTPETVTISQNDNKQDTKSKDVPTTVTNPASQVKTGIRGVGYLGIVLVIAIIAFVILNKKKKEK